MTDPLDPEAGEQAEVDTPRPVFTVRRPLVLAGVAVLVVVAVVVTLVATAAGDDDRPVPSGSMPTLGSQFAVPPADTPSSAPGSPNIPPPYPGNPLWTVTFAGDENEYGSVEFTVSPHGYVLHNDDALLRLDRSGTEVWRFTPPEVDYYTVHVTGPQVLVGYASDEDRWPQPQVVIALDESTGKELWRETEASLWRAATDTVYMSVCYGGQNARIGDCRLSARDPKNNTIRWQVPTYASSRVINDGGGIQAAPTPSRLLVEAYPSGADTVHVSSHDPATGATLGSGFHDEERYGQIDVATERTVVTVDDHDENPADGCTATITGYAISGDQRWRQTARVPKLSDGKRCGSAPVSYHGGRMGFTAKNGAPGVLNVDTGKVVWSAPPGGQAVAATADTLLVVEPAADEENADELVAYRIGNAKPVWRAPFPSGDNAGDNLDPSLITRSQVLFTANEEIGYDLKTGEAWSYSGALAQSSAKWFAVCDSGTCRGYAR